MTASEGVSWAVCVQCEREGGIGVRLPDTERCWTHSSDQHLGDGLKRLGEGGVLDLRGVQVPAELLKRILAAVARDPARPDHPLLVEPRFDSASFGKGPHFGGVTFGHDARFTNATFGDGATFAEA